MTITFGEDLKIKKIFHDHFFKIGLPDNYQKRNNSVISSDPNQQSNHGLKINHFELFINIIRNYFWIPNGETPPNAIRGTIFIAVSSFIAGISLGMFCIFCNFSICCTNFCKNIPKYSSKLIIASIAILTIPSLYVFWICFCCWRRIDGYDWWMIPQL